VVAAVGLKAPQAAVQVAADQPEALVAVVWVAAAEVLMIQALLVRVLAAVRA
tara:strand:- start:791 stop:946 length:156 start_codon:yes stop_codon:yes gene_type:complete